MRVLTHDGQFHADDVLSVAILSSVFTCEVIRSRDEKWVAGADVVLDVGGRYEEPKFFDHHQRGGAGSRLSGIPYASAGLIWKTFGHQVVQHTFGRYATPEEVERVFQAVDRSFIAPVDAMDTGTDLAVSWKGETRPFTFSHLISGMNPRWNDRQDAKSFTDRFETAISIARLALYDAMMAEIGVIDGEKSVLEALQASQNHILILEKFVPWQNAVLTGDPDGKILFVVFSVPDGTQWNCQAVPDKIGSFGKRKSLPAIWGGLTKEQLQFETGVKDAVFCHSGLFICGAGSREGAIAMATLACKS